MRNPYCEDEELRDALKENGIGRPSTQGRRDRLLLEMLYQTGLRRSELVGIRYADIDMEAM